ncbi:hypothetical protein N7466_009594 [Penicillium verhagenii]|uniref:uncharacterized protein n=1 Tax=Penicillium verhagenii TaxID=1562060 RepID=UPI0025458875|nr:uncharacterized protein N7466_009594 [Penicillium verhagenii]KAJ5921268.1 hypothetical protein N7466_009594 [Penicillium verhagenii]
MTGSSLPRHTYSTTKAAEATKSATEQQPQGGTDKLDPSQEEDDAVNKDVQQPSPSPDTDTGSLITDTKDPNNTNTPTP